MKFIYRLNARGNYFKLVIASFNEETGTENYVGMYDFPIRQCFARGIYVNDNGMVMQRGIVFLCAFPGKTINFMEFNIGQTPDGQPTQYLNDFYLNDEQLSMYGFFENLLTITG